MSNPSQSNLRTLDDVLKEYDRATRLSKRDLDSVPETTRAGFGIQIRQAKDALPKLRIEYLTRILKNAFGFFVEGEDAEKTKAFVDIAVANGACSVDADALFQKLADEIQYSIGPTREFAVTQVSLLDHALKKLVEDTGYDGTLNRTTISELRVVKDRAKLVDYIRELVARHNGSTPVTVYAQRDIVDQAFKNKFTGRNLVVIVRNAAANNRAALGGLFRKVTTVDVDGIETVDEPTAEAIFRKGLETRAPQQEAPPAA